MTLLGGTKRKAPVRTEPHPTCAEGSRRQPANLLRYVSAYRVNFRLVLWELEVLIEPGKKERNRDWKPYKEGRVVRVVAAVVILAAIVPTTPVASVVPSVGVVPLPSVGVVPLTPRA